MAFHNEGPTCAGCNSKLELVHPKMQAWFHDMKKRFIGMHISHGFRNKEEQNELFAKGLSKLTFPKSKHNHVENGRGCSKALDVFLIDEDGTARFTKQFGVKLQQINEEERLGLRWGGVVQVPK